MRPTDLMPQEQINFLLKLHSARREWISVVPSRNNDGRRWFDVDFKLPQALYMMPPANAYTYVGLQIMSLWLGDGPKVFSPTPEQCRAMEEVEINLTISEFSSPFPALLVATPRPPYTHTLVARIGNVLAAALRCPDDGDAEVTSVIGDPDDTIEYTLGIFQDDIKHHKPAAVSCLRIALNCCLALSNFGCHAKYLYPKEVERDKSLARERTERGERARQRVALAVQSVSFSREVKLFRREAAAREPGAATGVSMPPHWRRGHWASQPCGKGLADRKRILRPPVLVRADLFAGEKSDTATEYKG